MNNLSSASNYNYSFCQLRLKLNIASRICAEASIDFLSFICFEGLKLQSILGDRTNSDASDRVIDFLACSSTCYKHSRYKSMQLV